MAVWSFSFARETWRLGNVGTAFPPRKAPEGGVGTLSRQVLSVLCSIQLSPHAGPPPPFTWLAPSGLQPTQMPLPLLRHVASLAACSGWTEHPDLQPMFAQVSRGPCHLPESGGPREGP